MIKFISKQTTVINLVVVNDIIIMSLKMSDVLSIYVV